MLLLGTQYPFARHFRMPKVVLMGNSQPVLTKKLAKSSLEEIACGAYYVAVLTSRSEVAPGSNNKKREQNERTYASSASTPMPTSSTLTPLTVECKDL